MKLKISLPIQLVVCLLFSIAFGAFLPKNFVEFVYTASVFVRDLLIHFLPLLVFTYIATSLGSFRAKSLLLIFITLISVCLSNAIAVIFGYGMSSLIFPSLFSYSHNATDLSTTNIMKISTLWEMSIKPFIPIDKTLLAGALIGIILGFFPSPKISKKLGYLKDIATNIFKKFFSPLLPVFVLGFLLKMSMEGTLVSIIQQYTSVFIISTISILVYLFCFYLFASKGNFQNLKHQLSNMYPAAITGFSTVSSVATMPITIQATENNLKNRNYADFVIPATVNIHLVGDGVAISITALALMFMTGDAGLPNFLAYINFVIYYCLAKFSCVGVPGAGVLVLLPVFQQCLGMSNETATIIASIYMLQDPIITSANIMGNGAFAVTTHRIYKFLRLI